MLKRHCYSSLSTTGFPRVDPEETEVLKPVEEPVSGETAPA
jgi:hypothetical protein